MFEIEDSFGVVFSITALLQNVPRAVQAWGLSIPGEADGTYKLLYNDYTVLVFGTHSIYQREKTLEIQHQFRPIAFMMVKSESKASYVKLYECTRGASKLVNGMDLLLSVGTSDKASYIKEAFEEVWPGKQNLQHGPFVRVHTIEPIMTQRVKYADD